MSGASFTFVGFAILVALCMAANRSTMWRQLVMLVASVGFLASTSHDTLAFLPFVGFVVAGWIGLRMTARNPERAISFAIVSTLALFFWIKKYVFVPSALWLSYPYVTIGVSYILFRMLHLIIETRSDPAYARMPFRVYLVYLIGFNTLIAGPIQLFDDYAGQQEPASPRPPLSEVGKGTERIVVGLFKANVLAAAFATLRDQSLIELERTSSTSEHFIAAAAVFALYPFFLYCNFSGYIDIVIGVSRLMSQRLPENFDRPFSATSFIDFWNRWHITLSRWLKTYVFNPLLMTLFRRFPSRRLEAVWGILAFFVTFFLIGVWHGQTTAFLFFGFLQGFGVAANKVHQLVMSRWLGKKSYAQMASNPLYKGVARGLTFTWFTFTLTWFWATWGEAVQVWAALSAAQWIGVWLAILAAASVVLWGWETVWCYVHTLRCGGTPMLESRRLRTAWFTALLVISVVVVMLASQPAPGIVYKSF